MGRPKKQDGTGTTLMGDPVSDMLSAVGGEPVKFETATLHANLNLMRTAPRRWEYKTAMVESVADLNQQGAEGWELMFIHGEARTGYPTGWFKREVIE